MEKTRTTLTRSKIEAARPQIEPYRLWDARVPGLFLRVQPSGAKTWNVQWSRTTSKSVGKYPILTLDAARTQALAILSDAAENGTPQVAKNKSKVMTLRAFIDEEYAPWAKTHLKCPESTCERIRRVYDEFLSKPLQEINSWSVEKLRAKRREKDISASTCNRDLIAIKAALSKAVEWGFLLEHPLQKVKSSKVDFAGVVRYFSGDEEKRLRAALAARDATMRTARESANLWRSQRGIDEKASIERDGFGDHLTPLILVAMNTGLRRGELTSLTWADIDLPSKLLTVRAGYAKSGKARHVPLNTEAANVLSRWKKQCDEETVFNIGSPKTAWRGLMAAAEVEAFRFHDLRHHFASRLVMAGVDLNTVRELLGHADLKMTLRYAHLAPEHKAEAVERLTTLSK